MIRKLRTFFIDLHGCVKNDVDAEVLATHLIHVGLREGTLEVADVIFLNSCAFIESAKKESLESLFSIRRERPDAKLILCGCLATRYAHKLLKTELPEADGFLSNRDLSKVSSVITALESGKRPLIFPPESKTFLEHENAPERIVSYSFPASRNLKINEGCSNHCTFCAIPLIRGEVKSRGMRKIRRELEHLVSIGVKEINLVAQDTAAYGTDLESKNDYKNLKDSYAESGERKVNLATLLDYLSAVEGDYFLRLLYIHPDHFDRSILDAVKRNGHVIPYFDIPFQSGDDEIIKCMGRSGTKKRYIELVNEIRKSLPRAVIRTTFLVGFPGETEKSFNNTLDFLREIKPLWSGTFLYSREENTPASKLKGSLPKKILRSYIETLRKEQEKITGEALEKFVGSELRVLIEEVVETGLGEEGLAIARAYFEAPAVDGNIVIGYDKDSALETSLIKAGGFAEVKVASRSGVDLYARLAR